MADTAASLDCVPNGLRNLRACLLCSLIKTFDQFEMDGCDNCDSFLQLKVRCSNYNVFVVRCVICDGQFHELARRLTTHFNAFLPPLRDPRVTVRRCTRVPAPLSRESWP